MKITRSLLIAVVVFFTAFSMNAQTSSFFAMNYSTAAPLGNLADYTSPYSWRGFSIEGRTLVKPSIAVGGYAGWNVFYEKLSGTFEHNNLTVTGTQWRYINAFPMMVTGYYQMMNSNKVIPYFGLGVGTIYYGQRTEIGSLVITNNSWRFGLMPTLGGIFKTSGDTNVMLSMNYNYGFKTSSLPSYGYLAINLGLTFATY